jgi:NO-binding membrane sensor protein with MHYT domain
MSSAVLINRDVDPFNMAQVASDVSYAGWHIVLSFFTSLVGCVTTLELLQRRTSTKGLYNWAMLFAAAITMGGFGIWAMHFVGNRAIVLEHGDPQRQILYNPGFTALSFFVPILVLVFAFYTLGVTSRARQLHIAIAACLTGAAVCGMHYLGQLGVENYHCSYHVQNVIGAAIISVIASYVALSVFFRLRQAWTDSWWKRALCGAGLAVAVSGMHWTAAAGTIYHWKGDVMVHGNSKLKTSIIASSLVSVVTSTIGVLDPFGLY